MKTFVCPHCEAKLPVKDIIKDSVLCPNCNILVHRANAKTIYGVPPKKAGGEISNIPCQEGSQSIGTKPTLAEIEGTAGFQDAPYEFQD